MSHVGRRKTREGSVVRDRMDKTVVVAVETTKIHSLYKKGVTVIHKHKAHDESNACEVGDKVRIVETRPLSKEKRWRVAEVISKKEESETRAKRRK